jgi:DNA-binding MarR family transcriptional regulator
MIAETTEREALLNEALQEHAAVLHSLRANAGAVWFNLDLTMGQLKALQVIARQGPLSIGGLGGVLGVGKPAASLLVDALVRLGLVDRREDANDRRRTLTALTPTGRELVDQLAAGKRERLARCLERMSDADLAALVRGLRALCAVAESELTVPEAVG